MTALPVFSLGISPCPNDTYIFDALIHKRVSAPCNFHLHMADVEALNTLALTGSLDVTKLSLAAVLPVLHTYTVLTAGAALGRGCGPLLVTRKQPYSPTPATGSIATPGALTTAAMLLSLHGEFCGPRKEMSFEAVMPAVQRGEVDFGLVIHEGRFTYPQYGLSLVLDLGAWWEQHTRLPLPLGVIAIKREHGTKKAAGVNTAIRHSLEQANTCPGKTLPFIRKHAQEMEQDVLDAHIRTFVNAYSLDLGVEGKEAVVALLTAGAVSKGESLPDVPLFFDSTGGEEPALNK